jgi:hypothetical protein
MAKKNAENWEKLFGKKGGNLPFNIVMDEFRKAGVGSTRAPRRS